MTMPFETGQRPFGQAEHWRWRRGATGSADMASMTSGTLAGTGSFRCDKCGYVLTLAASDTLPACPGCGGSQFDRASLFGAQFRRDGAVAESELERGLLLAEAQERINEPGQYLVFEDRGETQVVTLSGEW